MSVEESKSAVLVIDVQQGLFERSAPIFQAEKMLQNINYLAEKAHRERVPVVYIQHSSDKTLKKGTRQWQFHDQIRPQEGDPHIHKHHGNAFQETNLYQKLQDLNVTRIIVTGLVTQGCVRATCLGGLELGFQVVLARDAHSNYSKTAAAMITKWHSKLADAGVELIETGKISF
jgi:nicotinamidase-related amidase